MFGYCPKQSTAELTGFQQLSPYLRSCWTRLGESSAGFMWSQHMTVTLGLLSWGLRPALHIVSSSGRLVQASSP